MGVDTIVGRHKERGRYDNGAVYGVLDEALICHVAFILDGFPYNMPMIQVRIGSDLFIHASIKSRFYEILSGGIEACVTATLLDGIVLAKSAYNSSMNYRSALVFGRMAPVTDEAQKRLVAERLTEKIARGRWADCRQPSDDELKATGILRIPIETFSVKIREGPPADNPSDLDLPYWSGVVPVSISKGEPITAPSEKEKIAVPEYL